MPETFRVLLVEDDPADANLAQCAINDAGFPIRVDHVTDGVQCMQYLAGDGAEPRQEMPRLILLDLNMPRMDGREVLRRLKIGEPLKRIPVVVLTTSVTRQDIDTSYDLGANSYISKPIDFEEFTATMKLLLSYWFDAVRLPA